MQFIHLIFKWIAKDKNRHLIQFVFLFSLSFFCFIHCLLLEKCGRMDAASSSQNILFIESIFTVKWTKLILINLSVFLYKWQRKNPNEFDDSVFFFWTKMSFYLCFVCNKYTRMEKSNRSCTVPCVNWNKRNFTQWHKLYPSLSWFYSEFHSSNMVFGARYKTEIVLSTVFPHTERFGLPKLNSCNIGIQYEWL